MWSLHDVCHISFFQTSFGICQKRRQVKNGSFTCQDNIKICRELCMRSETQRSNDKGNDLIRRPNCQEVLLGFIYCSKIIGVPQHFQREASTNLFIACSFPVAEWQGKGASSKVVGNLTTDSLIFFSKSSTRFNCSACPNWHRSNLPWARHLCGRPVEIHGTLTQKHMYLGVAPSITVANCSQYAGQLKALVFSLATLRATQNHWSKLHLFEQRGCIHWCWAERSPMRNLES